MELGHHTGLVQALQKFAKDRLCVHRVLEVKVGNVSLRGFRGRLLRYHINHNREQGRSFWVERHEERFWVQFTFGDFFSQLVCTFELELEGVKSVPADLACAVDLLEGLVDRCQDRHQVFGVLG
jgi:hypothetical protein